MREVLWKWTFEATERCDQCSLYLNVKKSEFYRVLMNPLLDAKFARVNDSLSIELTAFNTSESSKKRRKPKHFSPHLAEHKQEEKYKWKGDPDVLQRDKKKPLEEIGISHGKQKRFSHTVITYSLKNVERILWFWYISEQGRVRVFVRYSTLTEHPQSAEEVIRNIRGALGLPTIGIDSISE